MQFSRIAIGLVALISAVGACGDNGLGPASDPNVVDTVTIYAKDGTPISSPSAFSISERLAIRTDQSSAFDFMFNIDGEGRPVFLPLAVLGLGSGSADPGFKATTQTFDEITVAQRDNFVTSDTVAFIAGDRFIMRSRVVCTTLNLPTYGKMEVLSIDPAARSVTFRYLVNINCGYIGLQPGIPEE